MLPKQSGLVLPLRTQYPADPSSVARRRSKAAEQAEDLRRQDLVPEAKTQNPGFAGGGGDQGDETARVDIEREERALCIKNELKQDMSLG